MSQKQREELYHASTQTDRIYLENGTSYIDFTAHFKYLGTFISFDLTDDHDINHRIMRASQSMGALKHYWDNPYTDLKSKYVIFQAIPASLLLWGCETWALRQSHIDQLNSFWHRSIRRILKITIQEVKDDHIKNTRIRRIFFNIPDAEAMVTIRQMNYLGKTMRGPNSNPPKQLIPAWIDHPRPRGGVLTTNKKALTRGLHTLLPTIMTETSSQPHPTTGETITKVKPKYPNGDMHIWLPIVLDEELWNHHISNLRQPGRNIQPPPPNQQRRQGPNDTPPTPNQDDNTNTEGTNHEEQDDHDRANNNAEDDERNHHPQPPGHQNHQRHGRNENHQRQPNTNPPNQNHFNTDYDRSNVGRTLIDSLRAMSLTLQATGREIRTQFRKLSLVYHPDRHSPALGLTLDQTTSHFQLINNAYAYLRTVNIQ